MRYIVLLVETGIAVLFFYFLTMKVLVPIAQYLSYVNRRTATKTRDIDKELEEQRKKIELDELRFERSRVLEDRLNSIFEEAHQHKVSRTKQEEV